MKLSFLPSCLGAIFFLLAACDKQQEQRQVTNNVQTKTESSATSLKFSVVDVNENEYKLLITDTSSKSDIPLFKEGGAMPTLIGSFNTSFCGKDAVVVTLQSDANSGITYGRLYSNIVIEKNTKKLLDEIVGGEVKDKENDKVISDNQKQILAELKAGTQDAKYCAKIK